jgi:hypothetical protein
MEDTRDVYRRKSFATLVSLVSWELTPWSEETKRWSNYQKIGFIGPRRQMFMVMMMTTTMMMMMMDNWGVTLQTPSAHIDVAEEWNVLGCNAVRCVQYHCLPKGIQVQAVQPAQRRSTTFLKTSILEHPTDTVECQHGAVWCSDKGLVLGYGSAHFEHHSGHQLLKLRFSMVFYSPSRKLFSLFNYGCFPSVNFMLCVFLCVCLMVLANGCL